MSVTVVSELPSEPKPEDACQTIPVWQIVCQDGPRIDIAWDELNERWAGALTMKPGAPPLTASAPGVAKLLQALIGMEEEASAPATPARAGDQGE
jgi:hypothetical protein